jgi:leader peptidase (prepilin peptidase)/N-methyltransferase
VPLLSYWLLRGRCRTCGAPFSIRYFVVELLTGLAFAALFYLEIVWNVLHVPVLEKQQADIALGLIPNEAWVVWGYHAVLVSFLIVTSLCDLEHLEIPLTVTVTGTIVGLIGAALLPWPWPNPDSVARGLDAGRAVLVVPAPNQELPAGVYPWPVWNPARLPPWLAPGSWRLGLATGLAGALAGMVVLRAVRFLFGFGRGIEGLGVGDADLLMMAGSFIGWQPILMSFFVSVFPGLVFGVAQLVRRGNQAIPFGPSLAAGVVLTLLLWPALGRHFQLFFFDPLTMGLMGAAGAIMLLVLAFVLRLIRGRPAPEK